MIKSSDGVVPSIELRYLEFKFDEISSHKSCVMLLNKQPFGKITLICWLRFSTRGFSFEAPGLQKNILVLITASSSLTSIFLKQLNLGSLSVSIASNNISKSFPKTLSNLLKKLITSSCLGLLNATK